ncbi:hypothetical protein PTQ38_20850 [Klebsiella michiganensis]|uniref:hypothetical protein n=1 Tax=Klebsiella michiganensis TaxID=1134687 RepID=UPI00287E70E9|nr:hypothetical protein [Klebsiella michiganensis]MDS7860863.1 hypothetical protein [Klebsiella michiganensis]
MTSKLTITDERVISVIERLEHYACNLKWTNVRGAQDLLTAADGLRELQERRKAAMDSEPVAWRWRWSDDAEGYWRYTEEQRETRGSVTAQQLYRHAQPAPVLPDGYVMVPKEPTETMINAWLSEVANWRGHVAGYKAMLAVAPQEVNHG